MLDLSQMLAILIFVGMFVTIIFGKIHRFMPALIGAILVVVVVFVLVMKDVSLVWKVLNLEQIWTVTFWLPGHAAVESRGINWQTIIFIAGMMIMVESMGESGFFRWLCYSVAWIARYQIVPIMIGFILLSGFLAMFIDSITVLLFMTAAIIELARLLKFDPVPLIIASIIAANTGGSATMCGDPPNIIIGTAFGYTFTDFAVNTGPIALSCLVLVMVFFAIIFRRSIKVPVNKFTMEYPKLKELISDTFLFKVSIGIFIIIVILLITHANTGLSVAFIGLSAAVLTVVFTGKKTGHILRRIDWKTLLFFIGLFVCVGGLEETGVLKLLAENIGRFAGGNPLLIITIVLWISAIASAIVDNIPFAATMVPIIADLSGTAGMSLPSLSWALALGTDIGGNATPIGASANVVGTALAEKAGYPISWKRYMKYAIPATLMTVGLSWIYLIIRYN